MCAGHPWWHESALVSRHPEIALGPAGEGFLQNFQEEDLHGAAAPQYFTFRAERQECLQQILLGPEASILKHDLARIVGRQEHVMHVHQNSVLQPR